MSDWLKCILAFALMGGGWYYANHRGEESRKFTSPAGKSLVMLQGKKPEAGKPIVLEFWGSYCGPCIQNIPHMNQLYTKFGKDAQFVAVSGEDTETVRAFMRQRQMLYPIAIDPTGEFFKSWGVEGVPNLVLLNPDQTKKWQGHPGEMTDEKFAEMLKK